MEEVKVGSSPAAKSSILSSTYSSIKNKLPTLILPTINSIESRVTGATNQTILTAGKFSAEAGKFSTERFLKCAYSVTNCSSIPLNVSLNQVGPLFHETLLPLETFERRVPDLWFKLQIRSHNFKSDAHSSSSVYLPILILAGPVSAVVSLLAIPVAAVVVGGSALASLLGFGAASAELVVAGAASTASVAKSGALLGSKMSIVPGGTKLRNKMIDAANKFRGEIQDKVRIKVINYFETKTELIEESKVEQEIQRGKSLGEVEITGYDVEKCLRCETGKKKLNEKLRKLFMGLELNITSFQPKQNPVLRIIHGPELEERGSKSFLVFYPLLVVLAPELVAQPISLNELPITSVETSLLNSVAIVQDEKEAEKLLSSGEKGKGKEKE